MTNKISKGQRTILAFDFGTKSIGVAVGNELTGTANALDAIKARDGIPNQEALVAVFQAWKPDLVVVGLPLNMDGTWQDVTFKARKFANRLHENFKVAVEMKDERLTTTDARAHLFADGGFRNLSKGKIDSTSAVLILEAFMTEQSV